MLTITSPLLLVAFVPACVAATVAGAKAVSPRLMPVQAPTSGAAFLPRGGCATAGASRAACSSRESCEEEGRTSASEKAIDAMNSTSLSDGHEIVREEVVYSRWRRVIQRTVRTPKGKVLDFDIVDQKGAGAVIIFAWCTKTKTATILREYNPGCHRILNGLAAGIIETCPDKHDSDPLLAAQHELEEECHLRGGTWHRLTEVGAEVAMDKYNACMITAYLVLDPEHVDDPRPLDEEEDIEIVRGVPAAEVLDLVRRGEFNLVGSFAALLAVEKLRELGEYP